MSQFERVYKIDRLLRNRTAPNKQKLLAALDVSEPTLKRDLEYMRSRLGAPVIWDRHTGCYGYAADQPEFTIPGLWFSADEIHALLLIIHIVDQIQPSFLGDQVKPFRDRLRAIADTGTGGFEPISRRVRMVVGATRLANPACLDSVIRATLTRRRLSIVYQSRSRLAESEREISPGRLIYYRTNWYLDAWCHSAGAVRRFAVDAIRSVRILETPAQELPPEPELTGYGIFSGAPVNQAVLRFNATIAPWVVSSVWHPDQELERLPDGGAILRVPYSHEKELLMDILRHGADVEVLAPESLRCSIAETLVSAASLYQVSRRTPSRATATRRSAATG
jgi:predicted DNA-binding transcriptional regulator YafY